MTKFEDPLLHLEAMLDALSGELLIELDARKGRQSPSGEALASEARFESYVYEMRQALCEAREQYDASIQQRSQLARSQKQVIEKSQKVIEDLRSTQERLDQARRVAEVARERSERLSSFGQILDRSSNEIYIFETRSLRFVHVNEGACTNTGYTPEELVGMTPIDLIPELSLMRLRKLLMPIRSGKSNNLRLSLTYRRKDGSTYPVEAVIHRERYENREVYVAVTLDISDRRGMELALKRSREEAIAADRAKSEFLANMSHEIRTPMTAILGFSELLQDEDVSQEEKTQAIRTIRKNGHHLLNIINDILDLSKIEAGRLEIEQSTTNVPKLLQEVVDMLEERAYARGNRVTVRLVSPIPQYIQSDPTRLKQAFINLLGNAIKFTENGLIIVEVEFLSRQSKLIFRVVDTGIGIAQENLNHIFEPFAQADTSTTRKFGGTGLGLVITRRIAEILGGCLNCSSELGVGSTFCLQVATGPVDSSTHVTALVREEDTEANITPLDDSQLSAHILLVEDGLDNQRLIKLFLEKAGATVALANNGREGVDAVRLSELTGETFDLILMDMQMPVMDGYDATRTLRRSGYTGLIVALTAHAMKGQLETCLAAGCDGYLTKPIDRVTLVSEINRHLQPTDNRVTETV